MSPREELMDSVDAMVFSSDMFCDEIERQTFERYLARWNRALAEYKRNQAEEL